jgi:AraC family transcriptional regulator
MSKETLALALDDRHRPEISARRWPSRGGARSGFPVECPDPHVASLALNMRDEIQAGRLYSEALSLALSAYLFGRYSRRRAPATPRGIVLSTAQARRVRDYVSENLGGDIGLSELAHQVGLSPHYFSLLFKRAFGVSPHQYILSARIHRARRLLTERKMAISEIALELGFADQSHFSKVFKNFVGATPRRYRALFLSCG